MPINHRFDLTRVYWNSWFYLLTNLSLSLFDFNYYNLHPSVLDILSTPCPRPFLRLSAVFFLFDPSFISSISDCFPISLFEFLFHTSHQNSFNQKLFQHLLVCVFEHTYNHYFEFFFWNFVAHSHLTAINGRLVMLYFREGTLS